MLGGDVAREDAAVVAVAVHSTGVARDAVLAETRRRLMDRAPEVHTGDRGALPERRLRRQLVPADCRDAELRKVLDRTGEARRRDDVVDLEDEVALGVSLARVHAEGGAGA